MIEEDRELEDLFEKLRDDDRKSAPEFWSMTRCVPQEGSLQSRTRAFYFASAALALFAIVSYLFFFQFNKKENKAETVQTADEIEELMQISSWTAASDTVLAMSDTDSAEIWSASDSLLLQNGDL